MNIILTEKIPPSYSIYQIKKVPLSHTSLRTLHSFCKPMNADVAINELNYTTINSIKGHFNYMKDRLSFPFIHVYLEPDKGIPFSRGLLYLQAITGSIPPPKGLQVDIVKLCATFFASGLAEHIIMFTLSPKKKGPFSRPSNFSSRAGSVVSKNSLVSSSCKTHHKSI